MIVNPQVFNFRLAIGTLLTAIAILVAYGFTNHNAITAESDFLKQEKKLLQGELNKILKKYDSLGSQINSLKSQVENEKAKTDIALDSLELLKVDVAVIPRYREEIVFLNKLSQELKNETSPIDDERIQEWEKEKEFSTQLIERMENEIDALKEKNLVLQNSLNEGKYLYANFIGVTVISEKASGKMVETDKAKLADHVEVCFVIGENPIADPGQRKFYIQILEPDNNVLADKGAVSFGDSSLIYSDRILVDYQNESKRICASIPGNRPFKKGTYHIAVFENERNLGHTQIELY